MARAVLLLFLVSSFFLLGCTQIGDDLNPIPRVTTQATILADNATKIQVSDVKLSRDIISTQDKIEVTITLTNAGESAYNLELSSDTSSSFLLQDDPLKIGSLQRNGRKTIQLTLVTNDSVPAGYYSLPIRLAYSGSSQPQTLNLGHVTVVANLAKYEISGTSGDAKPNSPGTIKISFTNAYSQELSDVKIKIPLQSSFYASKSAVEKSLGNIASKGSGIADFDVTFASGIKAGNYELLVGVSFTSNGRVEEYGKKIPINLNNKPQLSIYMNSDPSPIKNDSRQYTLSINIHNEGAADISVLTASVSSDQLIPVAQSDFSISDLRANDFSWIRFAAKPKDKVPPGKYKLNVVLRYKDAYGDPHVDNLAIDFEIFKK